MNQQDASPQAHDPYLQALRGPKGLDHFHAVVHSPDIYQPDPFDIATIHTEARDEFRRLLDRARDPERATSGRSLLVLGEAGAGKTHLLRSFRHTTHSKDAGYVAYLQMTTTLENYERYLLGHIIDALALPFDHPRDPRSSLQRLSDHIVDRPRFVPTKLVEQLRTEEHPERLRRLVNKVVNRLVMNEPLLAGIDSEVLPALVYQQSELPTIRRRVTPLLRCHDLSKSARDDLGGIAPLLAPDDPMRVITHLASLMRFADQGAFVILVDQLETSSSDLGTAEKLFRRAMQVLCDIVDRIPNCILVVSCLGDFWHQFEDRLAHSIRDRLRQNPGPVALTRARNHEEVAAIVSARLAATFDDAGLTSTPPQPVHPFDQQDLSEALTGKSGREVVEATRQALERSAAEGGLPRFSATTTENPTPSSAPPQAPPEAPAAPNGAELSSAWSSFLPEHPNLELEGEAPLCELLAEALKEAVPALFPGAQLEVAQEDNQLLVETSLDDQSVIRFGIALCDRSTQGGGLGRQLQQVAAKAGDRPVAIFRTDGFQYGPSTKIAKIVAELIKKGWLKIAIEDAEWRQLDAFLAFAEIHRSHAAWPAWVRTESPVSRGAATSQLLAQAWLDRNIIGPSSAPRAMSPTAPPPPRQPTTRRTAVTGDTAPAAAAPEPHPPAGSVHMGRQLGHDPRPLHLDLQSLTKHAAVVGGSGSGKTTLAMHLIEQALLKGIPVLVVDRKGDLASWALPDAFQASQSDAKRQEQQARLQEEVAIRLFTPGDPRGSDIALPLLPHLDATASGIDRDEAADGATAALSSMLGFKDTGPSATRRAALRQAIRILFDLRPGQRITLQDLTDFIAAEDPALVSILGTLPPNTLPKLAENLGVLALNNPRLLSASAPELSPADLLGTNREDGRTALTIVSTIGLGSEEGLLFWVARLFSHLSRYASQNPKSSLQALVLLDEADLYLPATSQPSTKPEVENALRRWRSAGIGLLLASQSPADFDYRCRDNLGTWFVGLVKESNAHKKLAPLFSSTPLDPAKRLPRLSAGQFIHLTGSSATEFQAPLSLTPSTQIAQHQIRSLAT